MEADWEVEIGGGAAVIEADWPGFVDLRVEPKRILEIAEAAAYPPLAGLLLALNGAGSAVWTSKCDRWEPEPGALATYIDMLPREGGVFAELEHVECFCRAYVDRLARIEFPECGGGAGLALEQEVDADSGPAYTIELVIRAAIAGQAEGFGITAYLGARAVTPAEVTAGRITPAGALALVMAGFADAAPPGRTAAASGSKLQ